jgi:O-antigen ligase
MRILENILNSEKTYVFLIVAVLSTLLLDFAFGSISLGVLIVVCFLNILYTTPKMVNNYLPLIAIFVIILLSLFWTVDFQKSLKGLAKFAPFILVPLAFMCIQKLSRNSIDTIFEYFASSNVVFAIIFILNAVLNFLQTQEISVFFYHNLVSLFDLNAIYVSSFFLLSYSYLILKDKLNTFTFFKVSILFLTIILLSSKLIIFLLFLITIIVFFKSKVQKTTKLVLVLFFALGIFLIAQTDVFKDRINNEFDKELLEVTDNDDFSMNYYPWSGSSFRLFQIRVFWELLQEDDFFFNGYGVNASQEKIVDIHNKYKLYFGFNSYNFHNQYIQIFAEIGIIGLVCLVIVLFLLLRVFLQTKNILVLSVFLLFSTLFFTESYLCTQRGIIHFMIYIALIFYPDYKLKLTKNKDRMIY